jgi:succinate dehydrogenase cytochrome b556 subunit
VSSVTPAKSRRAFLPPPLTAFIEGLLYRGREGHWLFIGHRLSGLGTLLFLTIHILDTSTVYFAPDLYPHAIAIYQSTPFMLQEMLLVVAVIYHGVNGLRIILYDAFPEWWKKTTERQSFWRVAVLTTLLSAAPMLMMGRNLYLHNICRCAPERTVNTAAINNFSLVSIPLLLVLIVGVLAFGSATNGSTRTARPATGIAKNLETYSWLFMRWSGALLIPLVWIHVLIQDVLVGVHAIDLNFVALRLATLGWQVYDIALLAFAFGHGMNGLRVIVDDYVLRPGWNRALKWIMLIGWVVITAIGAVAIINGVKQ